MQWLFVIRWPSQPMSQPVHDVPLINNRATARDWS